MAPVVLKMKVRCYGCERRIRKAIRNVRGVRSVSVYPETGRVVVHGTADATVLMRRIWDKTKRSVTILNNGSLPWGTAAHYAGMAHLAPPPQYAYAPAPYGHYSQPPPGYGPYGAGDHWASDYPYRCHQCVPNGTPTCSIL